MTFLTIFIRKCHSITHRPPTFKIKNKFKKNTPTIPFVNSDVGGHFLSKIEAIPAEQSLPEK